MIVLEGVTCPFCPTHSLDPLGHHAVTCKYNGDKVSNHSRLRDALFESCRQAGAGGQMEVGSGLGHELTVHRCSRSKLGSGKTCSL